jgi:HD-like signal output (HDOD) protein
MIPLALRNSLLELECIPTLPIFVQRLLDTFEEEDSTASQVEKILMMDPGVSARILRVANSTFFGLSGRVGTLKQAIVLLGSRLIQSIALSNSLLDILKYNRVVGHVPWKAYWAHSFACGWICQRLVQKGIYAKVGKEAFLCGLLHDIGKPLLWIYEAIAYQDVLRKVKSEEVAIHIAETEVLGAHHGEVGGDLAHLWKLPGAIQSAIRFHHEVFLEDSAASLVRLADNIANFGSFCDEFTSRVCSNLAEEISDNGVDAETLSELIEELNGRRNEVQEVAGLMCSQ